MHDFIFVLLFMFQNLFSSLHFSSPLKKIKITDLPMEKIRRCTKIRHNCALVYGYTFLEGMIFSDIGIEIFVLHPIFCYFLISLS